MLKVSVYPKDSFFKDYLEKIGVPVVSESAKNAKVIHFSSLKKRRIKYLAKKRKTTLFVFHVRPDLTLAKENLIAYVPGLTSRKDLGKTVVCYTNCPDLARLYFNKIGIRIVPKEFLSGIPRKFGTLLNSFLRARIWTFSRYLKTLVVKYKEKLLLE